MFLQTRASLLKRGSALEGKEISSLVDCHKSSLPVNAAGVCPWLLETKVLFLSIISG